MVAVQHFSSASGLLARTNKPVGARYVINQKHTLSLHPAFNVRYHVTHPHEATEKIIASYTVEICYNVIKEAEYIASLQTSVVLTNEYNVMATTKI